MYVSFAQSTAKTSFDQPSLPFAPGFAAVSTSSVSSVSGCHGGLREPGPGLECEPRLIRSVVEEAGLGRFVYLQGLSGRRYVFSSINADQISLYDKALFAMTEAGGDVVKVSEKPGDFCGIGSTLYVHLLDDESDNRSETLADLGAVTAQ